MSPGLWPWKLCTNVSFEMNWHLAFADACMSSRGRTVVLFSLLGYQAIGNERYLLTNFGSVCKMCFLLLSHQDVSEGIGEHSLGFCSFQQHRSGRLAACHRSGMLWTLIWSLCTLEMEVPFGPLTFDDLHGDCNNSAGSR